jgi:hypothetical protein
MSVIWGWFKNWWGGPLLTVIGMGLEGDIVLLSPIDGEITSIIIYLEGDIRI